MNSDTVISKTDAMNDTSLSSLYRRMTAGAAGREVDANVLVAAIDASDLPAERREAVAAVVAGSSAHASLARMLRELQPESEALAEAVRGYAGRHHAMLLANHGPVVAGTSLSAAADAVEELEATAKLYLLVQRHDIRPLTPAQVADIKRRYPSA